MTFEEFKAALAALEEAHHHAQQLGFRAAVNDKTPPVHSVARAYAEVADGYEVLIDAALESGRADLAHTLPPRMREVRWNAFRWSHAFVPGTAIYWTVPRYRLSAQEARRRARGAGLARHGGCWFYDGREVSLPGREVLTPIGSGVSGRLGLMLIDPTTNTPTSNRDRGKPVWYVSLDFADVLRGGAPR